MPIPTYLLLLLLLHTTCLSSPRNSSTSSHLRWACTYRNRLCSCLGFVSSLSLSLSPGGPSPTYMGLSSPMQTYRIVRAMFSLFSIRETFASYVLRMSSVRVASCKSRPAKCEVKRCRFGGTPKNPAACRVWRLLTAHSRGNPITRESSFVRWRARLQSA